MFGTEALDTHNPKVATCNIFIKTLQAINRPKPINHLRANSPAHFTSPKGVSQQTAEASCCKIDMRPYLHINEASV